MPVLIKSAIFKSTQSSNRIWHACHPVIFLASLLIKMGAVLSALSNLHPKEDRKLTFTPLYWQEKWYIRFSLIATKTWYDLKKVLDQKVLGDGSVLLLQPLGLFLAAGSAGSSRGKGSGRDRTDRGGVGDGGKRGGGGDGMVVGVRVTMSFSNLSP